MGSKQNELILLHSIIFSLISPIKDLGFVTVTFGPFFNQLGRFFNDSKTFKIMTLGFLFNY